MNQTKRVAILFSGNGSNLEAIAEKINRKTFNNLELTLPIAITNNPDAYGIERCKRLNIPYTIINHKNFKSREAFDRALLEELQKYEPDLVALAGFMRILSSQFIDSFNTINIHPSLLPLFKGAHAIKESFCSDMKIAGVTVHRVSNELDSGEILAQVALDKIEGESYESFKVRIHDLEHQIYPKTIIKLLTTPSPCA